MRKISKLITALAISWIGLNSFGFAVENTKPITFAVNAPVRDYNIPLSTQSQNDITYIVTMLGNSSLLKIMKNQSAIKKAGERLEPVHPFHFIGWIFTNEDLVVAANNIKAKGWAWKEFFGGIKKSLTEEAKRNNLKPEYIQDFANKLGIDVNLIKPSIQQGRWDDLVAIIMQHKTRTDTSSQNRYNI